MMDDGYDRECASQAAIDPEQRWVVELIFQQDIHMSCMPVCSKMELTGYLHRWRA